MRKRSSNQASSNGQEGRSNRVKSTNSPSEQPLGEAIRRLRKSHRLSVRTLASKCGFSPSFISQVELGQASPSISSLERIASGLGITLGQFFTSTQPAAPVIVRAGQRPMLKSQWSQAQIESVGSPRVGSRMEALFIILGPGGSSGSKLHVNETELFAVVFMGQVRLELPESSQVLRRGDAITLPAGTAHRWENHARQPAQLLKVAARIFP